MDALLSDPTDTRALLLTRWGEIGGALDGFPVAALLSECLSVEGSHGAVDRRAQVLVSYILTAWVSTIERDLDTFPAATLEVLRTIRQRMLDTRGALLLLRSQLHESSEFTPRRGERGAGPARWPVLVSARAPASHAISARP